MQDTSKSMLWTGRTLSTIATLFMIFDGVMKLVLPPSVVEASAKLGYQPSTLFGIGLALLICTLLYVIPRTAIFGAILLTGYLGGAVDANVRAGTPAFNLLFPVIFAIITWLGLWLRDARLRAILPLTPAKPRSENESSATVPATAN